MAVPIILEIPDSSDDENGVQISPVKRLDKGKGRAISATPARAPVTFVDLSQDSDSSTEPDEPAPAPAIVSSAKKRKFRSDQATSKEDADDSEVEIVYSPRKTRASVTRNHHPIDGPIPAPVASSSSSSSSSLLLPTPPAVPDNVDADAAFAARLAAEEEEAHQALLAREASDELYARMTDKAEKLAGKVEEMKRKKGARAGNESKIIFQVTMDGEGKTLEGDHDADNAAHLELVKADFNTQALGIQIVKVTYFVNLTLNERFEKAKIALGQAGRDDTERTLFHGTAAQNVQPILEDGFKIGGVNGAQVRNGTACGIGVYLAQSAALSMHYAQGCNKMFACRVLLGTQTPTAMHSQPLPVGQNQYDSYGSAGVFVARTADQVLPRYVVEFAYGNAAAGYAFPGGMPNINGVFGGIFGAGAAGPAVPRPLPGLNGWNPYLQVPAAQGTARPPRAKRARKGAARRGLPTV